MPEKTYRVLGLLSGSSLDGTDLAVCSFSVDPTHPSKILSWNIHFARTIPYPAEWISTFKSLPAASARELVIADTALGHYYGAMINQMLKEHSLTVDLIASHGHTIFHFPELKTTTQIGDGAAIVAETGIDTVTQLRSLDVALGGEGAPLAPLGDKYLYPGFTYYLNLGGIANLTAYLEGKIIAFDICPCNQILNALAELAGHSFDRDGAIASSGILNRPLLDKFQQDDYLTKPFPKSLDNTWAQNHQVKDAVEWDASLEDKMHTAVEFIAMEIARALIDLDQKDTPRPLTLFCTGGGALNQYLIARIRFHCEGIELVLPSRKIIEFKEVSFIALAGLFRCLKIPSLFSSVTGAPSDTINGALYSNSNCSSWS